MQYADIRKCDLSGLNNFSFQYVENSLQRSPHERSYGYPINEHLLQDLKFVQYLFAHF